jgi:hypothetical protein
MEARCDRCANGEQTTAAAENPSARISGHDHYRGGQLRLDSSIQFS